MRNRLDHRAHDEKEKGRRRGESSGGQGRQCTKAPALQIPCETKHGSHGELKSGRRGAMQRSDKMKESNLKYPNGRAKQESRNQRGRQSEEEATIRTTHASAGDNHVARKTWSRNDEKTPI